MLNSRKSTIFAPILINYCLMKRLSTLFITLLICAAAIGAEPVKIERLNYYLNAANRTAMVAYSPDAYGSITIPSTVEHNGVTYRVTEIEETAFAKCLDLLAVVIPPSITVISDYAFVECKNLRSVTIPNTVTKIGSWAFNFCLSLTSVTIPKNVTIIKEGAFSGCINLNFIAIPHTAAIESDAFWGCENLQVSFYDYEYDTE